MDDIHPQHAFREADEPLVLRHRIAVFLPEEAEYACRHQERSRPEISEEEFVRGISQQADIRRVEKRDNPRDYRSRIQNAAGPLPDSILRDVEPSQVETRKCRAPADTDVLVERNVEPFPGQVAYRRVDKPEGKENRDYVEHHALARMLGKHAQRRRNQVEPRNHVQEPQVCRRLREKQYRRRNHAQNRLAESRSTPESHAERVYNPVEHDPEHNQRENPHQVVLQHLPGRVRVLGREHERPANHDEYTHAESRKTVHEVEHEKVRSVNRGVVPGGGHRMLENHDKRREYTEPFGIDLTFLGYIFHEPKGRKSLDYVQSKRQPRLLNPVFFLDRDALVLGKALQISLPAGTKIDMETPKTPDKRFRVLVVLRSDFAICTSHLDTLVFITRYNFLQRHADAGLFQRQDDSSG